MVAHNIHVVETVMCLQLSEEITNDSSEIGDVYQLCCQLLNHGEDQDFASLYGRLREQIQSLGKVNSRHDVSVCQVKFRPTVAITKSERGNLLGKLTMLDIGKRWLLLLP